MCTTCGCAAGEVKIDGREMHEHVRDDGTRRSHAHEQPHSHAHEHPYVPANARHSPAPGVSATRMVQIEQDILSKNNAYAASNRQRLTEHGIFALNLVSSPGSGKTTLLCKTIAMLEGQPVAVIEGDQQTSQDAERIRATGAPAIQINTGKGCHLDAHMVKQGLDRLHLQDDQLLMIENVGNLVCPAAFDLGEAHKVAILSVTEGEDKPIKYPDMFRAASLMLLNKIDLLPYLNFDMDAAVDFARKVNPQIRVIKLSASTGEGMSEWLDFLRDGLSSARAARQDKQGISSQGISEIEVQLQRPLP